MSRSPPRPPRRPVDGVLVLDKPLGVSSTTALQHARRLLNADKAGHTGTLDPLATGVLPLCFGAATKLAQVGLDADKRYLATLAFGVTTTTGDREGEVVRDGPTAVPRDALERACATFVGALEQRPPMHSALKHEGKPLYALARAGIEVERAPRRVRIDAIEVTGGDADRWTLDVQCSKGTYIRTLAEAIGDALGCGAHLAELRRTANGGLRLADAITFDALEAMPPDARDAVLLPADALVDGWARIALDADEAGRFLTGLRRRVGHADAARVRVYGPEPDAFLGIGHVCAGELIADRLLSPDEVGRIAQRRRAPTHASATP